MTREISFERESRWISLMIFVVLLLLVGLLLVEVFAVSQRESLGREFNFSGVSVC